MSTAPNPADILAQLVAIPSVSNLTNLPLIECIQRLLSPLAWHHRLIRYTDEASVEKANLLVSPTPSSEVPMAAHLALVCHTDTVPYGADWSEATNLREDDGNLYGCGACDVKGFLACMLSAALSLQTTHLARPLCLVFTADEEIGCRGARVLVQRSALQARYAIVGEPTSLVPARAGKGYCLASVTVHGRAAHSAYPDAGASAIFAAARMLTALEALAADLSHDQDSSFSPPHTTLNVGEIHGGTAKNVIPGECSFLLEWRPIPTQNPGHVADRMRAIAQSIQQELAPNIRITVDVLRLDAGFATDEHSAVIQALLPDPSARAQTIAFGTEAPWLARLGAEAVVFGPGSMLTAHSPRECVPVAELTACTDRLLSAIKRLCG